MNNTFSYNGQNIEASKLAYDLELIYAKARFEDALRTDPDQFDHLPADPETEAKEYLFDSFCSAYSYYTETEAGELERRLDLLK